jgi:hypothetical protein
VGTRVPALVAVLALGIVPGAQSQNSASPSFPYLMRLVHARSYENICVLVRGDGQYHWERETAQKTEIFEGTLPLADMQRIQHWLAADELFDLTEDDIVKPAAAEHDVQLILSVHRPGHWQNLTFPVISSWQTYHESIVPLVQWLEELRKGKNRVRLKEEAARNNCLPPPKLELKTRPQ